MHEPLTKKGEALVIIPARNEAETIEKVIADVMKYGWEIVVVDDASSDGTGDRAKTTGVEVLMLPCWLGAWGAMQTGLRFAIQNGYSFALTMDADGQHVAESLNKVIVPVATGLSDVAIGTCPERASGARQFVWKLYSWLTGLKLQDMTSGLRAYNNKAMRVLTTEYATALTYPDIGVLLMMRAEGLDIAEVPVKMKLRQNGSSRTFYSWGAVSEYLFVTLIMSASKWRPSWWSERYFVRSNIGSKEE